MNFVRNYTLVFTCDNNKQILFFLIKILGVLYYVFFSSVCFLSENNKQKYINDLIPTCKIFSSRNYETIMIVLLSMRNVVAAQCPCLNMCVIRHGFLFRSWWSVISLDFDFNQQDIRKTKKREKLR
jgi:hypothetical protein